MNGSSTRIVPDAPGAALRKYLFQGSVGQSFTAQLDSSGYAMASDDREYHSTWPSHRAVV